MHGLEDGKLAIYAPDVLKAALVMGLFSKPRQPDGANMYQLAKSGEPMEIESQDGKTPNLEIFCKDLTGWNRKAIRIVLPAQSSEAMIEAVEQLCALAAMEWTTDPQ